MTDERIEKIKWAETQTPYAWLARTALEVIQELQARERAKDEALQYMALNLRLIAGYERISGDHEDCEVAREVLADPSVKAALAQQPADQPADGPPVPDSVWQAVDELNRASTNTATADQPAQQRNWMNDEVSTAEDAVAKAPAWERTTAKSPSDQPAQGERTRLRQQVDQAQAEVATWPERMTRSYSNPQIPLDPHTLERAAQVAEWAHMVPPDGGSPSKEEQEVAEEAARRIRNLRGGGGW